MAEQCFAGKTVLVTGAGGSIGTYLCKIIASHNASELRLLSISEAALYNVTRELQREYAKYRDTKITGVLGSAADETLLQECMPGVDIVIHAAAHKHVPLCEANQATAISNNVGSTWALMQAAAANNVEQFCLISSDKAVNPSSVMGATKRLSEILVQDLGPGLGMGHTKFFTVRFGNVMDSAGSVLPLWREQIAAGGPITLTHQDCERYFMSIPQACELVCEVVAMHPDDGTFVFDMGKPVKLIDLAKELIAKAKAKVEIEIIGLRPGEKLTEELHHGGKLVPTRHKSVFMVDESNVFRVPVTRMDIQVLLVQAAQRRPGIAATMWNYIA